MTGSERDELSAPILGTTDRERFLAGLGQHPAYVCRRLSSGRIAVTRLLTACEALQYGRAAYAIWKDHELCSDLVDLLYRWKQDASRLVFGRFQDLVRQAQLAYDVEKGGKGPAPDGAAAKRIREALDLYDEFRDAMEQQDFPGMHYAMATDLAGRISGKTKDPEKDKEKDKEDKP